MIQKIIIFILLLPGIALGYELPANISAIWSDVTNQLSEIFQLEQKQESLPDSAWLGADKQSNDAAIQKLLNKSAELLLSSRANELRIKAVSIKDEIPRQRELIEEYKNKKMSAPTSTYFVWIVDTVADLDKKTADAEAKIKALNAELVFINSELTKELRSWGLELSEAEAETLFSTVIGDGILQSAIIFENIKSVTQKLTELTADNRDNLDIARRYYGMYVVLVDILIHVNTKFVSEIDNIWQPQILSIIESSNKSIDEAKTALANPEFSALHREVLNTNIESNRLTIEAAKKYTTLLDRQRGNIKDRIEKLQLDRKVASNTFKTVQNVSDLSTLIRNGLRFFDSLSAMQLPQIEVFENSVVKKEFEEITRRLQAK